MIVPAELATLLTGWPQAGIAEQAFPFLTVDEAGFPHVALLSRAELNVAPDGSGVLAVVAGTRTRANLARSGRATLVAVSGTTAHYAKLAVQRVIETEAALGCALALTRHNADSLGIPLTPIGYNPPPELAAQESWAASRDLLSRLAQA